MADERWWLKENISLEEREELRKPENKALKTERRAAAVEWRLERAKSNLTEARRSKMVKWFSQWVRGEAMHEMAYNDKDYAAGYKSLSVWLRGEFVAAMKGAFRGRDMEQHVEQTIRAEVGKVLTGSKYTNDKAGQAKLEEYVRAVVKDEVKKLVRESLTFDINVKGRVYDPAAGQRRVDLGGDSEDD